MANYVCYLYSFKYANLDPFVVHIECKGLLLIVLYEEYSILSFLLDNHLARESGWVALFCSFSSSWVVTYCVL